MADLLKRDFQLNRSTTNGAAVVSATQQWLRELSSAPGNKSNFKLLLKGKNDFSYGISPDNLPRFWTDYITRDFSEEDFTLHEEQGDTSPVIADFRFIFEGHDCPDEDLVSMASCCRIMSSFHQLNTGFYEQSAEQCERFCVILTTPSYPSLENNEQTLNFK